MSAATDQRVRDAYEGRSLASTIFQHAVDRLRAQGCRCPLRFDGMTAVPHTPGDAATCPVDHRLTDED